MAQSNRLTAGGAALLLLLATGCGSNEDAGQAADSAGTGAASPPAAAASALATAPAVSARTCTDYRDDLTDRDYVIIYHAMTNIPPPRERWADRALSTVDRSVPAEEAWTRVNAQIDAQWAAVKDVRCITLRTDAGAQDYAADRGGVPLNALAPDTYYSFGETGETVRLQFSNAESANTWKMPADRAAAVTANYGLSGMQAEIRARIVSARPASNHGLIDAVVDRVDLVAGPYSRAGNHSIVVGE